MKDVKVEICNKPAIKLEIGEMVVGTSGELLEHIILHTFDGYVDLNCPRNTWRDNPISTGIKLKSGDKVTLTV